MTETRNPCPVCPVCGSSELTPSGLASVPFYECHSCGLLVNVDPNVCTNPNSRYEDDQDAPGALRLLQISEQRKAYHLRLWHKLSGLFPSKGNVLEIGCGDGSLLAVFKNNGWVVEGIEPSRLLWQATQDSDAICGLVHNTSLEGIDSDCLWSKPYDLILAMDVIEHLQDPFQLLNRAGSLLRPGGLLFLQTPNAGSLHRWWKKDKWEQYATEEHLILHTRKSLAISLQRSGWQSFSIKSFSGSSTDSELRFWLKWPVSFMLTLLGCGNALRVIARKTEV